MNTLTLRKNILFLLELNKINASSHAKKAGVTQSTLQRIISGESKKPDYDNLEKLAHSFRVTLYSMVNIDITSHYQKYKNLNALANNSSNLAAVKDLMSEQSFDYNVTNIIDNSTRMVPLIDFKQAIEDLESLGIYNPSYNDQLFAANPSSHRKAVALEVAGDSMSPEFSDGVIIVIDPTAHAKSSDYVVAVIKGNDEAVFRRYVKDGPSYFLMPIDSQYTTYPVTDDTRIVGIVTERHTFKSYK